MPLIYFFYPETRNLSLEQIDKLFTGGKMMLHWTPSMGEVGGTFRTGSVTDAKAKVEAEHFETKA